MQNLSKRHRNFLAWPTSAGAGQEGVAAARKAHLRLEQRILSVIHDFTGRNVLIPIKDASFLATY